MINSICVPYSVRYVWKYRLDHIAFWAVIIFFYAYTHRGIVEQAGAGLFLADLVVHNLLLAAVCYLNIYGLFEWFFKRSRYLLYGTLLFVALLVYSVLQNALDFLIREAITKGSATTDFFHNIYYNFSIGFFYAAFTLSLELSKRWYRQTLELHQLQTEKLSAELEYLKAQLNPHFLFNSLNTIYFQIDKTNQDARESLQKFSELLRYQLYECNEDRIAIEKELLYLESYVDLQRLRKSARHHIVFRKDDCVKGFNIAPLLILPFVENAFKHLSSHIDRPNLVELTMCYKNKSFNFQIRNTVGDETAKLAKASGIGLKNVQRRLELLYPEKHQLEISKENGFFHVNLQLSIV